MNGALLESREGSGVEQVRRTGIGPLNTEDPAAVGDYRVLGLLGEGGMGRVYLGLSPGRRLVAVKVIHDEYARDEEFRARFKREARAVRSVAGVFTAPVLEADPDADVPWLAVLYVPSVTLHSAVLRFGRLSEPAVRALATVLAEAIGSIHASGLVHRDLKPANVLLTASGPLVIDFGISRSLDGTRVTRTGAVLGTAGYMSPEQVASGSEPGPAMDVFALGAVLVFAATGRGPFAADRLDEIVRRVVRDVPRLDGVPASLRPVIAACLEKDPAARPSTADLLETLGPTDLDTLMFPGLSAELRSLERVTAALAGRSPAPAPSTPASPPAPFPAPSPISAAGSVEPERPALIAPGPQARQLSRRRLLGLAGGASGALALAGGGLALANGFGRASGGNPAQQAGVPPTNPAWTASVSDAVTGATLASLGTTLVIAWEQGAHAYSPSTGDLLWSCSGQNDGSAAVGGPVSQQDFRPCGFSESELYGWGTDETGQSALLTVNAAGVVTSAVGMSSYPANASLGFCTSSGSTGLFALGDGTQLSDVMALDLTSGLSPWSWTLSNPGTQDYYVTTAVAADSTRCFIQDGPDTYALNLSDGSRLWHTAGTVETQLPTNLMLTGGVLLAAAMHVTAMDPATGRIVWSTRQNWPTEGESAWGQSDALEAQSASGPYFNLLAAAAGAVFFVDGSTSAWSLNPATGAVKWRYTNPDLELSPLGAFPAPCEFASAEMVAVPVSRGAGSPDPVLGFVVLDPATGRRLGGYTLPPDSGPSFPWQVLVSGAGVFASSGESVCGFEGSGR